MRKLALFTSSPNQEENGSFLTHKLDKLFAKLKRERVHPKSLKRLKSMWIPGLYNEDFEKQGYSTEKS